jgi:hypothetical protein
VNASVMEPLSRCAGVSGESKTSHTLAGEDAVEDAVEDASIDGDIENLPMDRLTAAVG